MDGEFIHAITKAALSGEVCHRCGHAWHSDSCVNVAPAVEPAQAVKPLEWAFLDRYQTWIARGFDYDYVIPVAGDCYHLYYGDDVLCSSNSIEGLKEAANADYKRRVLGCLVNGGV